MSSVQCRFCCPEMSLLYSHQRIGLVVRWGHLKRLCPNVRRCKLLLLNYLQKFSRFPSAETKVQKNSQSWDLFRPPHLPQTHVGSRQIWSSQELEISQSKLPKSPETTKKLSTGRKVSRNCQKTVHKQKKLFKKIRLKVLKNCPRAR